MVLMPSPDAPEPEMLVGVDSTDLAVLVRDFAVRWLVAHPLRGEDHGTGCRQPVGDPQPHPERDRR